MSANHPIKISPDLGLAKITIDIALHNLEASKVLHDAGYYPEAVFFLQQSIEKACKSHGYYTGTIDEKIARSRDVGHNGIRVYNRSIFAFQEMLKHEKDELMLQFKLMRNDKLLSKVYPKKPLDIEDYLNHIQNQFSELETAKAPEMSFEELSEDLEKFNLFITVCEEKEPIAYTPENLYGLTLESYQVIISDLLSKYRDTPNIEKIISKSVRDNFNTDIATNYLDVFFMQYGALIPLMELAVITYPHENTSRYATNGLSPNAVYDSNHPIVRAFPIIYKMSKKIFSRISRFYDKHSI